MDEQAFLAPARCFCEEFEGPKDPALACSGCKVVYYCGAAHQKEDRKSHKAACSFIKQTREKLEHEESALRNNPGAGEWCMPADVFTTRVGRFWSIDGTRAYMKARFAAANALLLVHTIPAVEMALAHFTDMLRLNRNDDLGVADIVPVLLLRLDREQECYDFLKWWAVTSAETDPEHDYADVNLPYLDIHGADALEREEGIFQRRGRTSLSHLATLTLLKLHFFLELKGKFTGHGTTKGRSPSQQIPKTGGSLMETRTSQPKALDMIQMNIQYSRLMHAVNNANQHFWELLVDGATPVVPKGAYPPAPGAIEEAHLALHHTQRAWQESKGAIKTIEEQDIASPGAKIIRVYNPEGAKRPIGDVARWKGTETLDLIKSSKPSDAS
ncbi:hypothetical protein B0H63DRAFT_546895 [Podospora didyma]|uniref:MYND-type domain-containing protein n=1 Tax=Podospora didyma TaxID=330526 RepID=A0AAE0NB50_9PEZI|nr:hypothetical protein B0H63DRAFT_546895 [Podospora didyma]